MTSAHEVEAPAEAEPAAVRLPRTGAVIDRDTVRSDYRLAYRSRVASLVGRREVLSGRATFGIFGDGKELAGIAMAKAFREGDWRAGYYRDQTFALAAGMVTLRTLFGQLYADPSLGSDPASGGRQMGNHFATRFLDAQGHFLPTTGTRNSSADVSCVAGWMPRLLGLAYASSLYRRNPALGAVCDGFSRGGDEVAFGTIGDASTSEGLFWETLNAAGVLQVPMLISVLDDGYGISVPTQLQTTKGSISELVEGFRSDGRSGLLVERVHGWDYAALCDAYLALTERVRAEHVPALLHVVELTQPRGHSTSGSHERYKTRERLRWEDEHDCLPRMRAWLLAEGLATEGELDAWEAEDRAHVEAERAEADRVRSDPVLAERGAVVEALERAADESGVGAVGMVAADLRRSAELSRRVLESALRRALLELRGRDGAAVAALRELAEQTHEATARRYTSHLLSESDESPLQVEPVAPVLADDAPFVDGRMVLQRCFDANLARDPRLFVIGEDVGRLGDVNLVFEGLQAVHGELRLTDTGIREATILGQAIGAAMRGLRPIADIQYLDYLPYAMQVASDDLATLRWRTAGGQKAPVIIRTKGHRLVGVWHAGSAMSAILGSCRGIHLCVPRDMTRAAGFYNTLLRGDDPAIVIEVLRGYRLKERVPDNVGNFTLPLGVPEVLRSGGDVTVVTYGACVAIALEAASILDGLGVGCEVVDVQTLLPFDVDGVVGASLQRTGAVLFLDEDVPGGGTAYMLQQVLVEQGGFWHLDAPPRTLSASPTRPAYGPDGEYATKPNRDDVVEAVYELARERRPHDLPPLR